MKILLQTLVFLISTLVLNAAALSAVAPWPGCPFELTAQPETMFISPSGVRPTNVLATGVGMAHYSLNGAPIQSLDSEDRPCPAGEYCKGLKFEIPADVEITRAYAYWHVHVGTKVAPGDEDIIINTGSGAPQLITGTEIVRHATPIEWSPGATVTLRAELPSTIFQTGANSWLLSGLHVPPSMPAGTDPPYAVRTFGIGILVFYREAGIAADDTPEIFFFDGGKYVFYHHCHPSRNCTDALRACYAETQYVRADYMPSSDSKRSARVILQVAGVAGRVSGGGIRPNDVLTLVEGHPGGPTTTSQARRCSWCEAKCEFPLNSRQGEEWDTYDQLVELPPGSDSLSIRPESIIPHHLGSASTNMASYDGRVPYHPEGCYGGAASFAWLNTVIIVPRAGCEDVPLSIPLSGGQDL